MIKTSRNILDNKNPIPAKKVLPKTFFDYTGVNLAQVNDWSPEMPFIDLFSASKQWLTQNKYRWDTRENYRLNLDENGYLKSLRPINGGGTSYKYVGTLINNDVGSYLPGQYVVLYDGEGTIEYEKDAKKNVTASTPGRDVIDVAPTNSGIYLKITSTDPKNTGNYLRNIRMVPKIAEENFASDIFNPIFLQRFKNFKTLRFIDWMRTNDSNQVNWSDRPRPDDYNYSSDKGVPVEIMVALANKSNTDPWFCMPHQATDEYVRNFANYVKNNLNPNLKVYVEYTNEAWNSVFGQMNYTIKQGKKEFPYLDNIRAGWDWFSKRTTEVTRIWDDVFQGNKNRVIGVMAAQASNVYQGERLLSYAWAGKDKPTHESMGIDAIGIAPYFGYYMGMPQYAPQVQSWTYNSDGGLSKLFDEITKGGVLKGGPAGGSLRQSLTRMQDYAKLAKKNNLELVAYEAGQHLAPIPGTYGNKRLIDLFIKANRDPRMEKVYEKYVTDWYKTGGKMMVHFSTVSPYSQWGSWGLLESLDQTNSPKYNAIMNLINQNY